MSNKKTTETPKQQAKPPTIESSQPEQTPQEMLAQQVGGLPGLPPDSSNTRSLRQAALLQMQRQMGNRHVQRYIAGIDRSTLPDTIQNSDPLIQRDGDRNMASEQWDRLEWIYMEDFFRLYANSRGHEAKTPRLQIQGTSWDRMWPPDWVVSHDGALLQRIRRRLRGLAENTFRLEWYRRFINEELDDAQRTDARERLLNEVTTFLGDESSAEQAEEARTRLRQAFHRFGTNRARQWAFDTSATDFGVSTVNMASYATVLRVFRRAIGELARGQEPSMSPGVREMRVPEARAGNPEHIGVGAARAAWTGVGAQHQRALRMFTQQQLLRETLTEEYCNLLRETNEETGAARPNEIESLCRLGDPDFSAAAF